MTNLIEGRKYVVGELNLCYCSMSHRSEANAKARDALFCQRSVKHSFATCSTPR